MREDTKVKTVTLRIIAFSLLVSGCANLIDISQINKGIEKIDKTWKVANDNLLKTSGTRTYKIGKKEAFRAMVIALNELELIVVNQDRETGIILATGQSPAPLSISEWDHVKNVEEPRMQAVAASEVGNFTASHIQFVPPSDAETQVNVIMLERPGDLQISLRFRQTYVGPRVVGLVQGTQPTPAFLKIALQKFWNTFEKIAFIQKGTFK